MIVVGNTSPLTNLAAIGQFNLLHLTCRRRTEVAKQKHRTTRPALKYHQSATTVMGPHILPKDWRPTDWLVPFIDGHACIHHGHERASDDHSACGPSIFCCVKAAYRYTELIPDSAEAHATWELIDVTHLVSWLDRGPQVMYFVFCDPLRPTGLLAIGLSERLLLDVLYRRVDLAVYAERADRLS